MVLLLLTVVAKVTVDAVLLGEGHGSDGGEGDALVGRAEEDVEVWADGRVKEGRGVGVGDGGEQGARVEEAGVEEVGGDSMLPYKADEKRLGGRPGREEKHVKR
jgi:hypothetical protein